MLIGTIFFIVSLGSIPYVDAVKTTLQSPQDGDGLS